MKAETAKTTIWDRRVVPHLSIKDLTDGLSTIEFKITAVLGPLDSNADEFIAKAQCSRLQAFEVHR